MLDGLLECGRLHDAKNSTSQSLVSQVYYCPAKNVILKVIAAKGLVEAWWRVDFNAEGTEFKEFGARKVDRREIEIRWVGGWADDEGSMEKGSISLAKR
jgi:hypothetical protein